MVNLRYTAEEASLGDPPASRSPIPAQSDHATPPGQDLAVHVRVSFVSETPSPLGLRLGSKRDWQPGAGGVRRGSLRRPQERCGWSCRCAPRRGSSPSRLTWGAAPGRRMLRKLNRGREGEGRCAFGRVLNVVKVMRSERRRRAILILA